MSTRTRRGMAPHIGINRNVCARYAQRQHNADETKQGNLGPEEFALSRILNGQCECHEREHVPVEVDTESDEGCQIVVPSYDSTPSRLDIQRAKRQHGCIKLECA